MTKIISVKKGSIAEEGGICPGDYLVAVNGEKVTDILEFKFITADDEYELTIKKPDGTYEVIEIYNEYGEDLGIEFEDALMTKAKSCANNCVFCFIDQLPKGMRDTLYFKDDDSRLSFLQGNYVTMTNMSDKEIDSIIKMHLSPINVSVQCTDPELRVKMLGNKRAGKLLSQMNKFADAGIIMNCQIVLCPGINDKEQLDKTLSDLSDLIPSVYSISVVPVGMTKYREGLHELTPFDKEKSILLIKQIEKWQDKFLKEYGKRIVYIADEFYIMAEQDFPPYEYYEDFPQLENGVGMASVMIDEFLSELENVEKVFYKSVTIVTGVISEKLINSLVTRIDGIDCRVIAIKNKFFGESITVSGLITGQDIINQLKDVELGSTLLIPSNMLRADTNVFLDDVTTEDIEKALNIRLVVVSDGADLVNKLVS